jgi:hypothetical protein
VPPAATTASTVLETVVVTGAAAGVALLGLSGGTSSRWDAAPNLLLLAAAIAAPIALTGIMMSDLPVRAWNRLADLVKRGRLSAARLSARDARDAVVAAYGNWLLYGIVAALALYGVSGGGYTYPATAVVGIFAASVLGGAVFLFVPQGIAVREGVLVYLLNALLSVPVPEAIVTAALTRLIAMAAEGVWAVAALGIRRAPLNTEAQRE